jgi:hypothetical protein
MLPTVSKLNWPPMYQRLLSIWPLPQLNMCNARIYEQHSTPVGLSRNVEFVSIDGAAAILSAFT